MTHTNIQLKDLPSGNNEIPSPKYHLWQPTKEGKIVGICWHSVDYSVEARLYPGWYYTLETCDRWSDHTIVHENDIELAK